MTSTYKLDDPIGAYNAITSSGIRGATISFAQQNALLSLNRRIDVCVGRHCPTDEALA